MQGEDILGGRKHRCRFCCLVEKRIRLCKIPFICLGTEAKLMQITYWSTLIQQRLLNGEPVGPSALDVQESSEITPNFPADGEQWPPNLGNLCAIAFRTCSKLLGSRTAFECEVNRLAVESIRIWAWI